MDTTLSQGASTILLMILHLLLLLLGVSHYWHCWLGHPNLSWLKKVVSFSESISEINCDACQLGKHHRVSFPSKESRSLRPFDLVHSDV